MRIVLALVVAGCIAEPTDPVPNPPLPPPPPPSDGGWTNPQGVGCHDDSECGSEICARDGACYAASSIREARVRWTVRGEPATTASCSQMPDLYIDFNGPDTSFGFAPVPCRAGQFTVDKLPTMYVDVELGVEGTSGVVGPIDPATGEAQLDLP